MSLSPARARRRTLVLGLMDAVLVAALAGPVAATARPPGHPERGSTATRSVVGFSIETPAQVASAAALGVTTDILYGQPPTPASPLGKALAAHHMTVIDATIAEETGFWECHRTHTVAPPPHGERNWFCKRDEHPNVDSEAVVLDFVDHQLAKDAGNPLVSGYWVLDDWPEWDGASAWGMLQDIRAHIQASQAVHPAVCGFGGAVVRAGDQGWNPQIAGNFSTAGCDMVGLYLYAYTVPKPSNGTNLDWTMKSVLSDMEARLAEQGWDPSTTPLLGIGQAWSGPFASGYTPGLSRDQMVAQATAFCRAGATSIGWYAWNDSDFIPGKTSTPITSSTIDAGITASIAACGVAGSIDLARFGV
jgi:hypothetical protein